MDSNIKKIIITVGKGGWYSKGAERLHTSLIHHGYNGDFKSWCNYEYPKSWPSHQDNPYAFKVRAFEWAISQGYKYIIWLDASCWVLQNPEKIFDIINDEGHYFWSSGHNCAQTCNDRGLEYFGITRDQAEKMNDISSGCVALNLNNHISNEFFSQWQMACNDGIFRGSREHDNQSQDPRFCFHRQDQCCASIIAAKLGMKVSETNVLAGYYAPKMPETLILCYQGM